MELSGRILDFSTKQPIPGASITITRPDGTYTGIGTAANYQGQFYLDNPEADYPNYFTVSSVGYQTMKAQLYEDFFIDYSSDFYLKKKTVELPPVVVTSNRNNNWALLLIPLALIIADKDKQNKVGKIEKSDLTTIALAGGLLLGWTLIKKALCKFGLLDCTPSEGNSDSPWNPLYYKTHAAPEKVVMWAATIFSFQQKAYTVYNAFSLFQDNYNAIMGVFQTFTSKSEVSFFSSVFLNKYGDALLPFLKDGGGILPWDGLSTTHLNNIDSFINSLPTT